MLRWPIGGLGPLKTTACRHSLVIVYQSYKSELQSMKPRGLRKFRMKLLLLFFGACLLNSCNTARKKERLETERLAEIERLEKEREAEEVKKKKEQEWAEFKRLTRRRLAASKERYPEGTEPLLKVEDVELFADEMNGEVLSGNVYMKVERNGYTLVYLADRVTVFPDHLEFGGNPIYLPLADNGKVARIMYALEEDTIMAWYLNGKIAVKGGSYATAFLSEN